MRIEKAVYPQDDRGGRKFSVYPDHLCSLGTTWKICETNMENCIFIADIPSRYEADLLADLMNALHAWDCQEKKAE